MNEHRELLSKWLRILFYAQIASMVLTLINMATYLDNITVWAGQAITVAVIWSLFQLKDVNPRYRTAAIAQAAVLICGFLTTPVNSSAVGLSSILLLVGSIAAWVTAYQEYHAHSELVAEADERLAKKWDGLFLKEILIGLAISAISVVGTTVLVAAGMVSGTITTVIIALTTITNLILEGLYLLYMKQTLTLLDA